MLAREALYQLSHTSSLQKLNSGMYFSFLSPKTPSKCGGCHLAQTEQ
jgi:hypothetical protein